MNLAVFVSGRGSNLNAILSNLELKNKVQVKVVISDKKKCGAFEIAAENSLPAYSVSEKNNQGYISFHDVTKLLVDLEVDLIVLAGFLKLIPDELIKTFKNRIINIHPALLPLFGGKGMYGMNVHKAVFESGMKISGATVHFVDEIFDNGKIITQRCVDISTVDSPEEIAQKVLSVEHQILPYVLGKFADKKIKLSDDRVLIEV
ncbi:MAG: phosphoribosylglycinamide formyltransferase [Ignavibacteria bacterium]|nr:phosphoribosylglycinamide formyltransferase [Ignavibacteria bacterium]